MSNYLRKGKRLAAKKGKKEVKQHTKEFYKILKDLDTLYELVNTPDYEDLREQITEDNMVELLQPLTEREIGKLEQFILKGKFGFYEGMEGDVEQQIKSFDGV